MKVVYATAARFDLIEIGEWIAQENPLRAASFVNELEGACESLASCRAHFRFCCAVAAGKYVGSHSKAT